MKIVINGSVLSHSNATGVFGRLTPQIPKENPIEFTKAMTVVEICRVNQELLPKNAITVVTAEREA